MVHVLAATPGEDDAPGLVVSQAVAAVGATGGLLGLLDPDGLHIHVVAEHGSSPDAAAGGLHLATRLPTTDAVRDGMPVWIETATERIERYPRSSGRVGHVGASVSLPMLVGDEPIGVLGVSFDGDHVFEEDERRFLEVMADVATLALHRAPRTGRSEQRLRQVLDALFSFVGVCEIDGTLVEANRAALTAADLIAEDVLGAPLWESYWFSWDPSVQERLRDAFARCRDGETARYDVDVRIGPERLVAIDLQLQPLIEDGVVTAIVPSGLDISHRRDRADRARNLSLLARRLSAAPTAMQAARIVTQSADAVVGARYVSVGLVDQADSGRVQLVQPAHLSDGLSDRWSVIPVDTPMELCDAIREGRTIAIDDEADARLRYPHLVADRVEAGVVTTVAVPLFGQDEVPFGALAFGWTEPHETDTDLLSRLETVAELCARTIERARLTDARAESAHRAEGLAALATQLAPARSTSEVADIVSELAPDAMGAAFANLGVLDLGTLLVGHHISDEDSVRERYQAQALDSDLPQATVARRGVPMLLGDLDEVAAVFPSVVGDMESADLSAVALLPVDDSDGQVLGVLSIAWERPMRFDPSTRANLATMVELCGQTLERARLHDAEHTLVEAFQARLLPPMPTIPGLTVEARYLPAGIVDGMGGDFYDGVVLADGSLAVIVGDVTGHGVAAAADMAQVRAVLTTLLVTGTPLDAALSSARRALDHDPHRVVGTVVVAVLDPVARANSGS